jgi:hypothetical protein
MKKLAILLFIISLFGSRSNSCAQYIITQLTGNSYADLEYKINDRGQIVWTGTDSLHPQIFFYDGNGITQLTNAADGWGPHINDSGQVVWEGEFEASKNEIFMYDGRGISQLTDNSLYEHSPQIDDNGHVVWAGGTSSYREIFIYDGNSIIRLAEESYDGSSNISGNGKVVWLADPARKHISYYDGNSVTQLAVQSEAWRPQINDQGKIVWRGGHDGSNYEIFLYDGGSITQLTNNDYYDDSPQINDRGQIVWHGYDGSDYEIFLSDGNTTTRITNNSADDISPQINDRGQIVWYGYDGSDYEIFLYDGGTITLVTDNTYNDGDPKINNNAQIVWNSTNGQDYFWSGQDREIFLATPYCASYNSLSKHLHITCVQYNGISYWLEMELVANHFDLKAIMDNWKQRNLSECGDFSSASSILHIPCVDVEGTSYWVNLRLIDDHPVRFDIQAHGPVIAETSPVIAVTVTNGNVSEAGPMAGAFTIKRSNAAINTQLLVHYTVGGTASGGIDYDMLSGAAAIPAGSPSVDIPLIPIDDSIMDEGNETVTLALSPGNYIIGTPSDQTITIEENDPFQVEKILQECGANSSGQCIDESCVDAGLEREIFDIWKERFLAIHGIDDQVFSRNFELIDVSLSDGLTQVWCRISYVFKLDWMRTLQNETISLGRYPLPSSQREDLITAAVNIAIEEAEQYDAQHVITVETLHDLIHQEYDGVSLSYGFCNIDFENVTGILWLYGMGAIDYSRNKCVESRINLFNGEIQFFETPCAIS